MTCRYEGCQRTEATGSRICVQHLGWERRHRTRTYLIGQMVQGKVPMMGDVAGILSVADAMAMALDQSSKEV